MRAIKARVSIVNFYEKENANVFDYTLAASKAKVLILSPKTDVKDGATRLTCL